jgi:hypothetical protein
VASSDVTIAVHATGFNARHLCLDGRSLGLDLRAALYA